MAAVALLLAACSGGKDATPTIDVGVCFDDADEERIEAFAEVPCDGPHDNEVVSVFDVEGDGDYPGTDALYEQTIERCAGDLQTYAGDPSRYEVFVILPTDESWGTGDREVVCALYSPGERLTAPARATSA